MATIQIVEKISERLRTWADSQEGKDALKKAAEEARKTTAELQKARQVDPADLHRHFTL